MLCAQLFKRLTPNGVCHSALPTITQLHAATLSAYSQWHFTTTNNKNSSSKLTTWPTEPWIIRQQRLSVVQSKERYHSSSTGAGVVDEQQSLQQQQQTEKSNGGILKRVLKQVGFTPNTKTRLKVSSIMLYENVADKVNYLNFFETFNMPNTFNSWFLVTELHVWMLLVRAMAEGAESGENGRFLRNCIVEAMWSDVNARAKKLGAHNPSKTRQQIEVLSEQFQAALIAYDEGIMSDDRVLAGALWRRFFTVNCDDLENIELLVNYVRRQMLMLDQMTSEDLVNKPKISWMNLKKINK